MGFASGACWFLLIKTLLISKKNNKKREAALKNEAGGDEKRVFFLLGLRGADESLAYFISLLSYGLHKRTRYALKILLSASRPKDSSS